MRVPYPKKTLILSSLLVVAFVAGCQGDAQEATPLPDLSAQEQPDLADTSQPDLGVLPDAAPPQPDAAPGDDCPAAVGKTGADLFNALHACVTGQTSLSYNDARDNMFRIDSDPANNNSVECIYSGRLAPNVTDRATANANNFNTEHSWPQSLGAAGIAMTDMHHLFPTDITINSKRGNYPFGVVVSATYTGPDPDGKGPSKLGTSADGKTVFEVRDPYKGNIARAIFYFYTRYKQDPQTGFSTSNFVVEEATLHKWNDLDPPDAKERAHNDAVFLIQKQRNPYIDHPEYIGKVGNFLSVP